MTEKLDFLCKHSKRVITFLIVFSLGVVIGTGLFLLNNGTKLVGESTNPVVAEVSGEKIYLNEYKERLFAANGGLGTPSKPDVYEATKAIEGSVLDDLVDLKIIDKEMAKRDITVTDGELATEAKKIFKDYDTRDADVQKAYKGYVRLSVAKDKLLTKVADWKDGFALFCYFNRTDMDAQTATSAATREQDKAYAQDYCTKLKSRLESGQSKYEDELTKLKADPKLGEPRWKPATMMYGSLIDRETMLESPVSILPKEIASLGSDKNKYYLLTLKEQKPAGQDVKLEGKIETTKAPGSDQRTSQEKIDDAMFSVVYIKDGNKGETTNPREWLSQKEKEYNVKTYPERIKL